MLSLFPLSKSFFARSLEQTWTALCNCADCSLQAPTHTNNRNDSFEQLNYSFLLLFVYISRSLLENTSLLNTGSKWLRPSASDGWDETKWRTDKLHYNSHNQHIKYLRRFDQEIPNQLHRFAPIVDETNTLLAKQRRNNADPSWMNPMYARFNSQDLQRTDELV